MIVGLTGKKRSGKDTFAATLVEDFGFERVAFADNVRQAAYDLDPWVFVRAIGDPLRLSYIVDLLGWEKAKEIDEVRRTLQRLGSDAIRRLDSDFWVRAVVDHLDPAKDYVVTDARFPNEGDALRAAGGKIVRVVRPGLPSTDTHASEVAMDDYDVDLEVVNDGTLEDLAAAVRLIARRL